MFLWELKKLKFRLRLRRQPKKLARFARLGKLKDNSFCSQIGRLNAHRIPKYRPLTSLTSLTSLTPEIGITYYYNCGAKLRLISQSAK